MTSASTNWMRSVTRTQAHAAAPVMLNFDATLITAHSDKQHAAGHHNGGFGFHRLLVSWERETLAET